MMVRAPLNILWPADASDAIFPFFKIHPLDLDFGMLCFTTAF